MDHPLSTEITHSLERAILRTVAFFDIFEYPLTDTEIWKFLYQQEEHAPCTLFKIRHSLISSPLLRAKLTGREGYYHLVGRDSLRVFRRERIISSHRKYARAKFFLRILAGVPFVRMIGLCNTLGLNASRDESDIDVFIVAQAGHLWLTRFFCTGIAHILRLRPRAGKTRDTFCLSFYASDDALDCSSLQLPGWNPDLYLAYWIAWCVPLYDAKTYEQFFQSNGWMKTFLPNVFPCDLIPRRRIVLSLFSRRIKRAVEVFVRMFGTVSERCVRAIQIRILPPAIREQMHNPRGSGSTGVVVSDTLLKFHTIDKREEIRQKFLARCGELGV